jgi:hypothetical protein
MKAKLKPGTFPCSRKRSGLYRWGAFCNAVHHRIGDRITWFGVGKRFDHCGVAPVDFHEHVTGNFGTARLKIQDKANFFTTDAALRKVLRH